MQVGVKYGLGVTSYKWTSQERKGHSRKAILILFNSE